MNIDFENGITDEEIDRVIDNRPEQLNNIKRGEREGERVRFDSTFERHSENLMSPGKNNSTVGSGAGTTSLSPSKHKNQRSNFVTD
jgi:hypothetical protein